MGKATTVQERIARVNEIKEAMSRIRAELSAIHGKAARLGPAAADARVRLESFIHMNESGEKGRVTSPGKQQELQSLKEAAESASKAAREAKETEERLKNELAALQEELDNFTYTARVDEVTKHQAMITEAAQAVVSLKSLIAEQQAIVEKNKGLSISGLYQDRQDLLAESVMGKDVAKEIKRLDGEIEAKEKELAQAEKKRNDAEYAIAGLNRKLADAETKLRSLEEEGKQILLHFLKGEAELVGDEYAQTVNELIRFYNRLLALDTLIMSYSEDPGFSIKLPSSLRIQIPAFNLVACNTQLDNFKGTPHGDLWSGDLSTFVEEEKAMIAKGLGIKI